MKRIAFAAFGLFCFLSVLAGAQQGGRGRLDQIERDLKPDVPRVLCLTENYATGGQPSEQAFSKLSASGFRSVLNLRTAAEGADLEKERVLVEKSGMRYFNIPVASNAPRPEQADEFLRLVRDRGNQPMMIHCATANRVGAFMMILRVLDYGWSEERALAEAVRIGLSSEGLKQFARDYIAQHRVDKS
jgi:protein tyrosine phosphatase (PTP) superfamily phosphohydrolase (DUF442 family)